MKRAAPFLFIAIVAAQASCAPALTCTEIGCADGVNVLLKPPSGHSATAGDYAAHVGPSGLFTFSVSASGEISSPCLGGPAADGFRCFVSNLGSTLDPVEIVVTRDSTEVLRQTFATSPQDVFPNGEQCGAVCKQGRVEVQLP